MKNNIIYVDFRKKKKCKYTKSKKRNFIQYIVNIFKISAESKNSSNYPINNIK